MAAMKGPSETKAGENSRSPRAIPLEDGMPSRAWLQTAMTTVGLTGALALIGYVAGASFELRLGLPNEKAIFSLEPCLREGAAFLFSSFSLAAFMAFEHPAPIVLALLVVGCAAWSARFLSEPARRRCTRILAFLALIAAGGKLLVLDFPLTAVENLLRRPLAFPPSMETGRLHGLAIHRLALSAFEAEYFSRLDKDLRPAVENFVATNSRVDKRDFVRRARVLYAVNATLTLALMVLSFVLARSKTLEDSGNEPSIPARSWSGLPKFTPVQDRSVIA